MRSKMRTLSEKGEKEFGDIFPAGVPCKEIAPVTVDLEGFDEPQQVFMVEWRELSHIQKSLVVQYMAMKLDYEVPAVDIQGRLDTDGQFPIRAEFVVESYDIRFFV